MEKDLFEDFTTIKWVKWTKRKPIHNGAVIMRYNGKNVCMGFVFQGKLRELGGLANSDFENYEDTFYWQEEIIDVEKFSEHLEALEDEVTMLAEREYPTTIDSINDKGWDEAEGKRIAYEKGYNKAKEKYNFTEEDMVEFANWIGEEWYPNGRKECWDSKELNSARESKYLVDGTKELLQLWKEQQPKLPTI